jgi:hypothetical protein
VPAIQMDLVADDRRGPPAKRVKWVEDFDLEPQTPGTMASPRIAAPKTWATLASLINSAKLHDIDPRHYLTDVLERIVSGRTKINQLNTLLPWNWKAERDGSEPKLAA